MHRRFPTAVSLLAALMVSTPMAPVVVAPAAHAIPNSTPDAPIGRLGDTLRIQYNSEAFGPLVADVTVHDITPCPEVPPGWGYNGSPRWRAQGGPWQANVTVHPIKVPNPYILAASITLDGVTPGADAYISKHTDAPDALDVTLTNAPAGSSVDGRVFWDVYRGLVTNVVLLSRVDGQHLAQWNL